MSGIDSTPDFRSCEENWLRKLQIDGNFDENFDFFFVLSKRWHWLAHSEGGMTPRAAHTAIYSSETDSLYVFGGYDLNYVLSDLEVYRFGTSQWEDEYGVILGEK